MYKLEKNFIQNQSILPDQDDQLGENGNFLMYPGTQILPKNALNQINGQWMITIRATDYEDLHDLLIKLDENGKIKRIGNNKLINKDDIKGVLTNEESVDEEVRIYQLTIKDQ